MDKDNEIWRISAEILNRLQAECMRCGLVPVDAAAVLMIALGRLAANQSHTGPVEQAYDEAESAIRQLFIASYNAEKQG